MPTFIALPASLDTRIASTCPGWSVPRFSRDGLSHVEFEFPAPPVASHTPQLKHARFGDQSLERYRHQIGTRLIGCQLHFNGRQLFEVTAEVFDQFARTIILARRRTEEPEL